MRTSTIYHKQLIRPQKAVGASGKHVYSLKSDQNVFYWDTLNIKNWEQKECVGFPLSGKTISLNFCERSIRGKLLFVCIDETNQAWLILSRKACPAKPVMPLRISPVHKAQRPSSFFTGYQRASYVTYLGHRPLQKYMYTQGPKSLMAEPLRKKNIKDFW